MDTSHSTGSSAHIKQITAQYWDQRAPSFDEQPQHVSQSSEEAAAWKDILIMLTFGRSGLSVLDVGTGTGFLAFLLAELGHRVVGIDISAGMLTQAREKAGSLGSGIVFQEADAERTGFPDHTFDLVISRHVIWNLPHPDLAIREWARVTKPAGVVGVINGIFSSRNDRWEEPYRTAFQGLPLAEGLPPEAVESLMRDSGLEHIRFEWLNSLAEIKRRTLPDQTEASYAPNRRYLVVGVKPLQAT